MRKLAMGLTVGAAVLVMSAEAGACSIIFESRSYETRMAGLRHPGFSEHIGSAHYIDVAIPYAFEPFQAQPSWARENDPPFGEFIFHSVENLRGNSNSIFRSRVGNDHAISNENAGSRMSIVVRDIQYSNSNARFWDNGYLPGNGIGLWGPGDCSTVLTFAFGQLHLVLRDSEGTFLSSRMVASEDDPWLLAVRTLVAEPDRRFGWAMELEEYLRRQENASEFIVEDCQRPRIRRLRTAGTISAWEQEDRAEISGPATDFETHLVEDPPWWHAIRDDRDPAEVEIDLEYYRESWQRLDSQRFNEFPFVAETCSVGDRFLNFGWGLPFFPIAETGMVDFTSYASQIEITGPLEANIEEVLNWVGTHQAGLAVEGTTTE